MSFFSLPVAKVQFPWPHEEEGDLRDQKQIAALTVALQASLARESASRQANVNIHWRLSSSTGLPMGCNGSQASYHCKVGPRLRKRRRNWQLRRVALRRLAACIVGFTSSTVRRRSNSVNISVFCVATSQTFCSKMPRTAIPLR